MTKKDFEAVAAIINKERSDWLANPKMLNRIAKKLADFFEDRFQGRFDFGRFMKACGVPDNESV